MADVRDFLMPDLGEGLTEAEIVTWLVAVGDRVDVDQPIIDVNTDKAAVQVPTPYAGVVVALHGDPGDMVAVGRPLISIDVAAEQREVAEPAAGKPLLVGYGTSSSERRRRRVSVAATAMVATMTTPPAGARVLSSPLVRRRAAELNVDLAAINGTGPGGSVSSADLRRHVDEGVPSAPATAAETGPERIPLRGARRITVERLVRGHAAVPAATAWLTVDATRLLELRDLIAARHSDVHPTPLAVLLRLCVAALQRYPLLNASHDAERGETVMSSAIHMGVATQTEHGLVVPVIRDCQRLAIGAIAAELSRLAGAARDGTIAAAELRGGTFTVTNYGAFGVDSGIAIINPPQAAILGVGRIAPRPWVVDGAVVARSVLEMSLVFDHRVCDGGDAGGFLRLLGDYVEHPEYLLA